MKKRRQRSDYERLIAEYEATGKAEGQQAFARRHGVTVSTLQHWLYRLRREQHECRSKPRRKARVEFVEVKPKELVVRRAERVEIELPVGVVIRLASGASGAEIVEVVRQLSGTSTLC